ncbi:hypothetical protein IGI37_001212 [Enterococcus sp. AZ194]|uniref:helix-turn-helix domain-containing protein n=1 Tax=Enterococcus sp. AZ194 TaxID=2774629 RepID=UPI003F227A9C
MVQNILVNEESKIKLAVLTRIRELGDGVYPIYQFETELGFSYVKMSKLIHALDSELQQIDPEFHLLNGKDKIEVEGEIPSVEDYQRLLCRESLPYRFLVYALLNPGKQLADFCIGEGLSQSSVMRRMGVLTAYFRENGIRLNCFQMRLTGKESVIRMILAQFIWYVSFGEELIEHFKNHQPLEMNQLFAPEDSRWMAYGDEREWTLYQAIAYLRLQQGYSLEENDFETLCLPPINKNFQDALRDLHQSETNIKRESDLIGFTMFYRTQYFTLSDPRLKYVKRYCEINERVYKHTHNFYDFCLRKLFTKRVLNEQARLLWIDLFNLFLMKDYFPEVAFSYNLSISPLMAYYHPSIQRLKNKINLFLEEEYRLESSKLQRREDLLLLLSAMVLPYYDEPRSKKIIRLGIAGVHDDSLLHFLFYHLKQITGLDIEICGKRVDKEYDLLLSSATQYLPENLKNPYYILDTENVQMLAHIQKRIDDICREEFA